MFAEAIDAARPARCMPALPPAAIGGRRAIIAVGKAAGEMMRVAAAQAGEPASGLVVTRHGHLPPGWPGKGSGIEVIEAGHPIPDAASLHAAHRALAIAASLGPGDELLVLLSGGGSALLAAPVPGVTLADKQDATRALLRSGATIAEINCIRQHLSMVKAGRLALAANGARVVTWLISDVPGDNPALVASGPTLPGAATLADARAIVRRLGLRLPASIERALSDPANEIPRFPPGETRVLASGRIALDAAAARARVLGYRVVDLGDGVEGEAQAVGGAHAALALWYADHGVRTAILSGGETSVTVTDATGRGGRNQEYLLGLALALDGHPAVHAIAGDTDGIDGTEDVAGAIVTPDTLARAARVGLDPRAFLARNDAFTLFDRLGDTVRIGPTLTNVNDIRAILIG